VSKSVKNWSNVDISETVKYRIATPSALKLVSGGLQNVCSRTCLLEKCVPHTISSAVEVVKDWSNVDTSETVNDRKAVPGALKPATG